LITLMLLIGTPQFFKFILQLRDFCNFATIGQKTNKTFYYFIYFIYLIIMSLIGRFNALNAYDIHKLFVNEYILTKPGCTSLLKRDR